MVGDGELIAIIIIVILCVLALIIRVSRCFKRLTGTDLLEADIAGYTYTVNDGYIETFHAPKGEIVSGPKRHITDKGEYSNWYGNHTWIPSEVVKPTCVKDIQDILKRASESKCTVRAVGSLHSWSDAAVTPNGIMILTEGIDKVLYVDDRKRIVKAEAGILLGNLYIVLKHHGMALRAFPNTDQITLGGALANSTHGTNRSCGTLCSLVLELSIIIADGTLLNLRADAPEGSIERNRFEAALCSVGNLGIIYSITIQCVPTFNVIRHHRLGKCNEILPYVKDIFHAQESAFVYLNPSVDFSMVRTQMPISPILAPARSRSTIEDICGELFMYTYKPGKKDCCKYSLGIFFRFFYQKCSCLALYFRGGSTEILSWNDAEIMVKSWKDRSFLNCEYALPLENIQDVVYILRDKVEKYKGLGYIRTTGWAMRNVGPDKLGFLTTTRDRDTVFVDIPYQQMDELEFTFFREVEKELISLGGRASWSRRFNATGEEILVNYPYVKDYIKVVKELDPHGRFTNPMRQRIFGF